MLPKSIHSQLLTDVESFLFCFIRISNLLEQVLSSASFTTEKFSFVFLFHCFVKVVILQCSYEILYVRSAQCTSFHKLHKRSWGIRLRHRNSLLRKIHSKNRQVNRIPKKILHFCFSLAREADKEYVELFDLNESESRAECLHVYHVEC